MSPGRAILATAAGLLLFALPFARYLHFGPAPAFHADHAPRHGGILRMVGDHHIELRRWRGRVDVFLSDANRAPVQPRAGWVIFDGSHREPLTGGGHRVSAIDARPEAALVVELELANAPTLRWDFGALPSGLQAQPHAHRTPH